MLPRRLARICKLCAVCIQ